MEWAFALVFVLGIVVGWISLRQCLRQQGLSVSAQVKSFLNLGHIMSFSLLNCLMEVQFILWLFSVVHSAGWYVCFPKNALADHPTMKPNTKLSIVAQGLFTRFKIKAWSKSNIGSLEVFQELQHKGLKNDFYNFSNFRAFNRLFHSKAVWLEFDTGGVCLRADIPLDSIHTGYCDGFIASFYLCDFYLVWILTEAFYFCYRARIKDTTKHKPHPKAKCKRTQCYGQVFQQKCIKK